MENAEACGIKREIFSHVVAREQLQFFGEVHIVRHHRADESHQLAEVVEDLTRCGNPVAMVLTRSLTVVNVAVLRFGAGFRHRRGRDIGCNTFTKSITWKVSGWP